MLRLEKINGQNVWDILKLRVAENQRHFVSSNDRSIIEAYTTIAGNGHVFPFGVYENDTTIGFLMIGFVETGEMDCNEMIPVLNL